MQRAAIGIDVGGTSIKAGLVRDDGILLARRRDRTPHDPAVCAAAVAGLVRSLRDEAAPDTELLSAVGVSVPGIVDEDAGRVLENANLGWRDLPVRDLMAEAVGGPVRLGHDVRAGALGEALWGAGTGTCLFVPLGTGLASALVIDARLVGSGFAGEIGQLRLPDPDDPGGPELRLEQIAGAEGMARRFGRLTGTEPAGSAAVFEASAQGDATATAVVAQAVDALARVLAVVLAQLGPLRIVVGGGASEAGEALMSPLRAAIARHTAIGPAPEVVRAELGAWAGCLGSAARVLYPAPSDGESP